MHDKLGRLLLGINDSATRDELVAYKLSDLSIPFTFGGGDSQESTLAMIERIKKHSHYR